MRLLPLLLLLAVGMLVVVTAAVADPDSPPYTIVNDESGVNDVPGQKDLTLQGVDKTSSTTLKVLWNWDETGTSGNNTLDACALFDTDNDGKANYAVCATTTGNPATLQSTTVYTCGDTRVDRCTSPTTPITVSASTFCTVTQSGTDPFQGSSAKTRGASWPTDTRAKCSILLSDINATSAGLINTCSYPSQQPNSDPSDCVLIPRDAFITIVKVANPNQGSFPFTLDGNATPVFTASGSASSPAIGVTTANGATHSLAEVVPSGWTLDSASCTGATGSNGTKTGNAINGIDGNPEDNITCTFNDSLQRGSINVTKSGSDSGSQNGAVFTLYSPAGVDANNVPTGASVGTCIVTSGQCGSNPSFPNLLPGTYTLDETTVPSGYTKPATLPATVTVNAGATTSVPITDVAQPGSAAISKLDDAGNPVAGAVFTVYAPAGTTNGVPTGSAAGTCTTAASGSCTISSLAAGTYTIDEVAPTGYAKDSSFPKDVTITNGGTTNVSATDPRQFKVVVLVCRQTDNTLYPSAVTIDGASAGTSLSASGATTAGLDAADQTALCGLSAGAKGGLRSAPDASNPHSASINIPNTQP